MMVVVDSFAGRVCFYVTGAILSANFALNVFLLQLSIRFMKNFLLMAF